MSLLQFQAGLGIFEGLKSYSRTDVELINRFGDLFRTDADWKLWVQEGLGALLEVAGPRVILLQRTNQIEPGQIEKLEFEKGTLTIGRDPDNDVVAPGPGVGRHHARITSEDRRYFLEDLGSANGTYLNDVKLQPHKPVPLNEGAQFLIFPYQFCFSNRQVWNRQGPIRIAAGAACIFTSSERWLRESSGTRVFTIKVSPDIGLAVLRVSEELLKALVHRISHSDPKRLISADDGLFEFVLLSVLERANRALRFPFHFSLSPRDAFSHNEAGILLDCTLDLGGAAGLVEIFFPANLLNGIQRTPSHDEFLQLPATWPVLVSAGYSDLTLEELTQLETGDILLLTSSYRLLLPVTAEKGERGWRAAPFESNPNRLQVEGYFERSSFAMENEASTPAENDIQKPNLGTLPVRVHIVLSQLEMTLAELNQLRPGSIVELDRDKSELVQLAVNGKIAGTAELVEIEGRLGVRVANWNTQ